MTIASTNVSFSAIATEKGIATSNLSLKSLSGKEVKMDTTTGSGYSSTYALAKEKWVKGYDSARETAMIVTSTQGTGSAGLNTAPYSMSEWVGYNPGRSRNGTTATPVVQNSSTGNQHGCIGQEFADLNIYCKKVSGVIKFYCSAGSYGTPSVNTPSSTTYGNISGETEIGEMVANTANMIPSGCTMDTASSDTGSSGTAFTSGASNSAVSGGAISTTNLGSTKIGYNIKCGGVTEGGGYSQWAMWNKCLVRFIWTWPTSPSGLAYESSYTDIAVSTYVSGNHGQGQGC